MSIQEVPQTRRDYRQQGQQAAQQQAPRMEAPVLDLSLVDAVQSAADAFREIEGERLFNNLLSQMLADSNARLERRGIRGNVAGGAEVESLHAQLKRANEANVRGSAAHKEVVAAGVVLRDALEKAYRDSPEDEMDGAMGLVNQWDRLTAS